MQGMFERQFVAEQHTKRIARLWTVVQVSLLIVIAFGLRMYAVNWGLPYVEHHDEPESANAVVAMLRNGDCRSAVPGWTALVGSAGRTGGGDRFGRFTLSYAPFPIYHD